MRIKYRTLLRLRLQSTLGLAAALCIGVVVAACDINRPGVSTVVIVPTALPTITAAPLYSMTPRFTATLIPTATPLATDTLAPTLSPTAVTPTVIPTTTPLPVVRGVVNAAVNLRIGPSRDVESLGLVSEGTVVTILSYSEDREWFLVTLEDSQAGWIQSSFIATNDSGMVAVLPPAEITRIAEATSIPATASAQPTLRPRNPQRNDILAYCDLPDFVRDQNKVIAAGQNVNIYWNWYALTPEQIQDHIDYGTYEVKLNDTVLDTWRSYRTGVNRQQGRYNVWWYVPVGKLEAGEYTVTYKLTWSQRISDGEKTFGPGGDEVENTGSCKFTVR